MEEAEGIFSWGFWGVFSTVLSVVAMLFIYRAQRKIKNLSYEVVSNTQLLGVEDEMRGKVKILYDGEEVNSVHLLTLKFTNFGNQPISSNDYERPLSIIFDKDSKILTHDVIEQEPNNLGVISNIEDNKIRLNTVLMNSKDSFTMKTLISNYSLLPVVDGRIKGVKSIGKYKENVLFVLIFLCMAIVLVFLAIGIYVFGSDVIHIFSLDLPKRVLSGFLFASSYVSMLLAVVSNKKLLNIVVRRIFQLNS